jgi:flagellar biosynthesis chaperone FliJ
MNITEVRNLVKSAIAEAMEKGGLPKSGGKLVHLKKELAGLKNMKESLGQLQIAEGGDQQFVAEYAHMQKFVTELEKIKTAHAKLAEMLDNQISEVEGKVTTETQKIKEMVGLIEKAPKKAVKKADKKDAPKAEKEEPKEEKEAPKADDKKKSKKLNEYEHHYEKVNGECRKYNDEGDYTVVSDYYCN